MFSLDQGEGAVAVEKGGLGVLGFQLTDPGGLGRLLGSHQGSRQTDIKRPSFDAADARAVSRVASWALRLMATSRYRAS